MADNVTIPATGSGSATPVIAADDCAGVQYQRVKLVDGTADSTAVIPGDATNGLDVDVTRTANTNPLDYDSGAGTASQGLVGIALPASGGPVGVSALNPLPITGGTLTPGAPAAATVGVTSAEALAAGASRVGYDLVNTSVNTISFGFGANAAVLNSGITLLPGGSLRVRGEFAALAVNAIASAASSNLGMQAYT